MTTIDRSGVRTQLDLGKDRTAVIKKVPVSVDCDSAVNIHVDEYGAAGVRLTVNGKGQARIAVRAGEMAVAPNQAFAVESAGKTAEVTAGRTGCYR